MAVAAVAAINIVVIVGTQKSIVLPDEAAGYDADAIVVLGASVFADGTPSSILQDRLDDAIDLYFRGAAPKLIMSGDNGDASYNECYAMKNYAIAQGVPSEDIFCDHAGFNTYYSMYRAQYIFGCKRIVVATQSYHLYRALWSAHALGMEAVGVASDYREYQKQFFYDLREIPARVKDFFQSALRLQPSVLGDVVSLNQSGDVTS